MNTTKLAQLLGSASVAAFAYAGAVSAQAVPESIDYFADYGDTYENIIDLDYDEYWDFTVEGYNELISEGALGAVNSDFSQVAVTQFMNVSAQTDSEDDTLIDLSHYVEYGEKDVESEYDGLSLGSFNLATAHTTSFDALLEGSQVAQSSFNTAALDITDAGEDDNANVALLQSFDGEDNFGGGEDYFGYDVDISAVNIMDAAAAYAGTATIDGQTLNADEELVNGVQQAAVSLNTFNLDSEVDTTIELAGQLLDTDAITEGYDYVDGEDGSFSLDAFNLARAYAPAPASSDLVDPRLATDLNDPSINNLDQVAAISINTISLGNAQVGTAQVGTAAVGVEGEDGYIAASDDFAEASDDFVAASDTDFTIYTYSNDGGTSGEDSARGQFIDFDNSDYEVELGNLMVATTSETLYGVTGEDGFGRGVDTTIDLGMERYDGVGDVAINNASQASVLTFNSIRNAGTGDLTLKEVTAYGGEDYASASQDDFDQYFSDFEYETYGENIALAMTAEGDADISGLEQIVQYGVNSISSGGALLSWNDDQTGIQQEINDFEYDFDGAGEDGINGLQGYVVSDLVGEDRGVVAGALYGGLGGANLGGLNTASAITIEGDAEASDVTQVLQMSGNTISAATDVTASIDQFAEDDTDAVEVDFEGTINSIFVSAIDPYGDYGMGNATIDTAEQIALFTFNSLSAGEALTTDYTDQHFDGDSFDFTVATINSAIAFTPYGDAGISGVDQIAQFALNTVSAGSFTGTEGDSSEEDLHQRIDSLDEFDSDRWGANQGNRLEAISAADGVGMMLGDGDASISDSSQEFILNANSVRVDGTISGFIEQDVNTDDPYYEDLNFGGGDFAINTVYALANQDMNDARWVGGNASIDGLTQTLSMSFNSVSAGSLDGATIVQDINHVDINVGNAVYADAEWGAASITGVSQQTINRLNSISITPPSLD